MLVTQDCSHVFMINHDTSDGHVPVLMLSMNSSRRTSAAVPGARPPAMTLLSMAAMCSAMPGWDWNLRRGSTSLWSHLHQSPNPTPLLPWFYCQTSSHRYLSCQSMWLHNHCLRWVILFVSKSPTSCVGILEGGGRAEVFISVCGFW